MVESVKNPLKIRKVLNKNTNQPRPPSPPDRDCQMAADSNLGQINMSAMCCDADEYVLAPSNPYTRLINYIKPFVQIIINIVL